MDCQFYQGLSIHFDGNSDKIDFFFNKGRKISGIFQIYPPRYPSHANSRDKESLNSSTQAKPSHAEGAAKLEEEQHKQGAAVQPYPVIT